MGSNSDLADPRFRIKPYQQIVSACSGALVTSLFMTPLDVVKIRLQAQQKAMLSNKCYLYCNGLMDHLCLCGPRITSPTKQIHLNGTFDALIKISRHEGPTSLWSGLSPTLVLAVPCTVLYFVFYEQMRVEMNDFYREKTGKRSQPIWVPLTAGTTARIVAVTVFSPLELLRTKMQSQKMSFFDSRSAIVEQIKIRGIKSLWRGLGSTIMRDVPFSAIYWMNYESLKIAFGNPDPDKNKVMFNFMAGAASGTIAAFVTLPFDVVKTHQQIELGEKEIYSNSKNNSNQRAKTTLEMLKNIYRNYGFSGLFTGLTPRIIKVAPACAIMISSFEYGKSFFQEYNKQKYLGKEDR